MTSQPYSIKLGRRLSRPDEDVASSDTSSSDLERDHGLPNGAIKSRLHTRGLTRLVQSTTGIQFDSLVLLFWALLILCVVSYFRFTSPDR